MPNAGQIVAAIRDVGGAKSLTEEEVGELLREGILAGLAKIYGPNVEAEIEVDEQTGEFDIVVLRRVVEEVEDPSSEISLEEARWDDPGFEVGDIMEIPVEFGQFGRNAVMAMKQRIVQLVRETERDRIRDEFSDRLGELLSGEVQQIERGKIVIMLNLARDAEAIVPWKDQNPRERFRQGDPIRAVLKKVDETPKGPRLILSRADPSFVEALFKLEVPEIYQGIVEIKEVAREVGGRTKLAVHSNDEAIDPVGACVGLKGSRVQAVVQELGGERIDIVPWHPDPEIFARRALAPARVSKVMSDPERLVITAIVDEDQLSLATVRTSCSHPSSSAGRSTCTAPASGSSGGATSPSSVGIGKSSSRRRTSRSPSWIWTRRPWRPSRAPVTVLFWISSTSSGRTSSPSRGCRRSTQTSCSVSSTS